MLSQDDNTKVFTIVVAGLAGLVIARMAWVYGPFFFRSCVSWTTKNRPDEQTPLIENIMILELDQKKMEEPFLQDYVPDFIVTSTMLGSLQLLGLNCNLNEVLSFSVLGTHYRKKLRETHPDKTHADTREDFMAVRTAFKCILKELSSIIIEPDAQSFLFKFGLNELFSIFVAKNDVMKKTLSQELLHWQQLRENSKAILVQQEKLILEQQDTSCQLEKKNRQIDMIESRSEQLTAEKLALNTVLIDFEKGLLSKKKVASLLKAADKFGGLTKIPGYGKSNPNPYGFFENSSSASSEKLQKTVDDIKRVFEKTEEGVDLGYSNI